MTKGQQMKTASKGASIMKARRSKPGVSECYSFIGQPVWLVMQDGSLYCGMLEGIANRELTLYGAPVTSIAAATRTEAQAKISALGLPGVFGGTLGGLGGSLGLLSGLGIWFRLGLGAVRFIFPLLRTGFFL
jgi:hypothetical protein